LTEVTKVELLFPVTRRGSKEEMDIDSKYQGDETVHRREGEKKMTKLGAHVINSI
jgi:hypothetical protein